MKALCENKYSLYFGSFLDATPTESEKEVYDVVNSVLDVAPQILQELQGYRGAGEEIRQVSDLEEFVAFKN